MQNIALATDYDGTLATLGRMSPATVAALERLGASGRRAILVTGRELPDLRMTCDRLDLFAAIVAENGAVFFETETGEKRTLCPAPPVTFVAELRRRGVTPLEFGDVIVATLANQSQIVLETIRESRLELQLIFNKESLMILPSGVNKASGLTFALRRLGIDPRSTVAVGDAENDHSLLKLCGSGVAVANAVDSLKAIANWVTPGEAGVGVSQLIERLVQTDAVLLDRFDHAAKRAVT